MENMASYCGESCVNCQERAGGKCAGCKIESGAAYSGSCPVKACAERKGYTSCDDCSQRSYCAIRRECNRQRRERHGVSAQKKVLGMQTNAVGPFSSDIYVNNAFLANLKFLFVLSIITIFVAIVEAIMDWEIPGMVCSAVYAVTLIRMSPMLKRFRTAGILRLIGTVLSIAALILTAIVSDIMTDILIDMLIYGSSEIDTGIADVLLVSRFAASFAALILGFVAYFMEHYGYSKLLMETRFYDLAAKWRYLAIWYVVLNVISGVIAAVIEDEYSLLIPAIGMWVVTGLKCYYLYKTEKTLRITLMEEV